MSGRCGFNTDAANGGWAGAVKRQESETLLVFPPALVFFYLYLISTRVSPACAIQFL
jgi:hypothetical protein